MRLGFAAARRCSTSDARHEWQVEWQEEMRWRESSSKWSGAHSAHEPSDPPSKTSAASNKQQVHLNIVATEAPEAATARLAAVRRIRAERVRQAELEERERIVQANVDKALARSAHSQVYSANEVANEHIELRLQEATRAHLARRSQVDAHQATWHPFPSNNEVWVPPDRHGYVDTRSPPRTPARRKSQGQSPRREGARGAWPPQPEHVTSPPPGPQSPPSSPPQSPRPLDHSISFDFALNVAQTPATGVALEDASRPPARPETMPCAMPGTVVGQERLHRDNTLDETNETPAFEQEQALLATYLAGGGYDYLLGAADHAAATERGRHPGGRDRAQVVGGVLVMNDGSSCKPKLVEQFMKPREGRHLEDLEGFVSCD